VAAYRIACEALANIARHAEARSCLIALTLVLQSHLPEALTTADMRAFGLRLVTATPGRPVQNGVWSWKGLPEQREE
jgi:hypothetical protein